MARQAWHEGWPHHNILPLNPEARRGAMRMRMEARAAVATAEQLATVNVAREHAEEAISDYREQQERARRAREDVIATRREEADLVRNQRRNVMALVGVTARTLRAGLAAAPRIENAIVNGVDPASGKKLTTMEQVRLLERMSLLVSRAAASAEATVKMERLLLGEPTEILEHRIDDAAVNEAFVEIEEAARSIERYRRRRLVIDAETPST